MRRILLSIILLLLIIVPLQAQDDSGDSEETHPLLEMLALVPDTENSRTDFLYYLDMTALEQASRIAISPPNMMIYDLLPSESRLSYMATLRRIAGGNGIEIFNADWEAMPEVVGFDFFNINQLIAFGQPPGIGTIYGGNFDYDSIGEAHAARDYTEETINGFTAWCGPSGCDAGLEIDFEARNRGNAFDPMLGRRPTVLLLPGYLASSPDLVVVEGIARAANGDAVSIADAINYRTLAEAITAPEGELIQVNFLGFDPLSFDIDLTVFETREDYEAAEDLPMRPVILDEWFDYGEMPAFNLMALADRQIDETQVAMVALLYTNEADAQAAADELAARLQTFSGTLDPEEPFDPFVELIDGAQIDDPYVYQSEDTGLYAAVASVSYPLPDEISLEDGLVPGMMYRYWVTSVFRRAFYVVAQITLPEWATTP